VSAPSSALARYEQARNWAIGSDPGLLRLRMAGRTTAALAAALAILYLLTKAAGQPLTVALLGVAVVMVSARAASEPDPRQQKITMALLPLPAACAITVSAVLAPHKVVGDIAFVVIMFAAVYARRYGGRGMALGMVTFMTYFFTLFLRATTAEVPWMIGSVVVGTLCSYVMSAYVLPDRPERLLRRTMRALRARMAIVLDTTAAALQSRRFDERRRRRLRIRIARLNDTALMVQSQIEEKVDPATLWPGVGGAELALRLFDAELSVERVAMAGGRAAATAADISATTRAEMAGALRQLAEAMRVPQSDGLHRATALAEGLVEEANVEVHRLGMAIIDAAAAGSEIRALLQGFEDTAAGRADVAASAPPSTPTSGSADTDSPQRGLRPTTRQAIQVAIAASLAIVVGELVSPARWYWAVIAAFVTFAGTTSWGETLTKGWQRLLGTVLGVPSGVLVATAVSGNTAVSIVFIFVCLFFAIYLMKVAYSWMIFWITTMLALLYGLLGQFSVHLLLLRIEETAIGAVIGATVALVVLPTHTRTSIRNDVRDFLTTLSDLIDASVATMFGAGGAANPSSPTETARHLGRDLQQFRTTAKPLLAGIAGLAGRRSVRRGLRMLAACDHYARTLARYSEELFDTPAPELADAVRSAAAQTQRNIDALVATLEQQDAVDVLPATDFLDTADTLAKELGDSRRLLAASRALRQIDRSVFDAAVDLGAGDIKLW
jgi:uncharacterized membrane protein YccC